METIQPDKIDTDLYQFSIFHSQIIYESLSKMAQTEEWTSPNSKTTFDILDSYIKHTFSRLAFLYNEEIDNKNKWVFFKKIKCCINTGLFTPQFNKIFLVFKKNTYNTNNTNQNIIEWRCLGAFEENDEDMNDFYPTPCQAKYFSNISEIIYNTELPLRVNKKHILKDERNIERIPDSIKNAKNLNILLDGAIEQVKKRIDSNYKTAVPQFHDNKIQFLLPLSLLGNDNEADLVLVVSIQQETYVGHTCLTLEQAYKNARLIASPDAHWLVYKKENTR